MARASDLRLTRVVLGGGHAPELLPALVAHETTGLLLAFKLCCGSRRFSGRGLLFELIEWGVLVLFEPVDGVLDYHRNDVRLCLLLESRKVDNLMMVATSQCLRLPVFLTAS